MIGHIFDGRRRLAVNYGVHPNYIDRIKAGTRRAFPTEGTSL